ncbi:TPA: insulinase family protein [Campylobacter fetus subsp. venerealis]|uniref:Zinc-dependent peptidase, M16 family n=1 Tax=Campylobacter fetus subsp. venerealis NCTC 10354 TaxID=983328 RepID=A0AAE6IYL8_CAMFE|nr:pitrilysin family protein [Campylobacter fetus]OCS23414.1 protease [Campylobacter fetus subsp. venerealis cfvi97/532]OCS26295.1 protease [Campylobacter fetus subsp. venerealis cfvB10]OCS30782.1 protease [Campylobacter fetus subsp. venerealis LMG 6570 = CCUG 33900]AHE94273.1 Zn-dependent peptidase, M16 family [Campylobacter fetus subsp. venerealis cfvi03/293]AIR80478.1 Zn-dependent peptidase, M16 family [Campylobacter fetus subsp. venerealis 97/608]
MLPKFSKITLNNGLEVYHTPLNLGSNVISIDLFYKVGSRNETMGKSGIAHMLEHLNFKSTKNRKAGEFDEIVKGFGGVNNASTGFDYTHYFIKCSNQNLDTSLELYSDIMENLNLKNEEFLPERDVVLEERRWRTDNDPIGFLYFRLFNNAFIYHPYHWTPIGFFTDIQNWSIDDIKAFWQTYYQPKNAFLMITGDIDEQTAFDISKKHFEHIKNGKDIPNFYFKEPEQNGKKEVVLRKQSDVEMVAIAYKISPFNHEDQVGLSAISDYLSSGKSSLLQKKLIDELNLVNQIYAYPMDCVDDGLFIFIAICNPDVKAKQVQKELLNLIKQIKQDLVEDEELIKIKNSLKSDFIYSLDSASKLANLYGSYIARGDITPLYDLQNKTESLTSSDVQKIAKKYFVSKNSTTIILKGTK